MANSSQLTLDPDAQLLLKLREVLLDAGYCEAGLAPTINDEPMNLPDPSAEAGAEPPPLATLIRLFFMSEDCRVHDVTEAIRPLTLEQLIQAGIIRREGGLVAATIRVQPYGRMLFLFKRVPPEVAPEEALMFISASSLEVAHLMTRHPARNALDIGTGCGFLATLVAPFCQQVSAIDVNPAAIRAAEFNARWNNLNNISFHAGNLLEPVRGQRFDRIVCNPPFLITPVPEVFSARYVFKHSGLPGDAFCLKLAREASQLLEEGGYFHMIFQWEEPNGAPWSSNLEKSFSGLGCDVWVARILTTTADEYAAEWVHSLSEIEQADSEILNQQAQQYFRDKNVGSTSTGLLTLRRASHRPNYLWFDEAPDDRREPYGENVATLFDVRARLMQIGDAGLLQEKLRVSPHLELLQTSSLKEGEWVPSLSELLLKHGLKYSFGEVDQQLLELLPIFNGERTVKQVIGQLQMEEPLDNNLTKINLPKIRELLWYGFLVPAQPAEK
ncbi:MAG: class I SAM-dependent methyltransferase [Candidatus Acidiferrum sp.]|jgi:methylase of polypeptide subunit release factors